MNAMHPTGKQGRTAPSVSSRLPQRPHPAFTGTLCPSCLPGPAPVGTLLTWILIGSRHHEDHARTVRPQGFTQCMPGVGGRVEDALRCRGEAVRPGTEGDDAVVSGVGTVGGAQAAGRAGDRAGASGCQQMGWLKTSRAAAEAESPDSSRGGSLTRSSGRPRQPPPRVGNRAPGWPRRGAVPDFADDFHGLPFRHSEPNCRPPGAFARGRPPPPESGSIPPGRYR